MIRSMVGGDQCFSQDGLPFAVRNLGEEIRRLIADQVAERLKIPAKGFSALVPGLGIRRRLGSGPIADWKFGRPMVRISRELKDVPLGDAQVFQHLPCRMLRMFGLLAAQARRELPYRSVKVGMRVAAL